MTTIDLHNAAAALGHQGGLSTSNDKQRAARRNGKRGGRPRKDQIMDAKTALDALRGKNEMDRTEAAESLATNIDQYSTGSEHAAIVRHLLEFAPSEHDTVSSIKNEFRAWFKKNGTYSTNA